MKHNYLLNTPAEEALKIFTDAVGASGFRYCEESVPVASALGRVLTRAVYAAISSPHYNASAMDGIAVRAADTFGASERTPVILPAEKYVTVDTGDPLPDSADAVIMVEDVVNCDGGGVILRAAVPPWQHVRQVGEDMCMGDMIAATNEKVTPALIGAFLAGGVTQIAVKKRPRFGIIPTGDEIVSPTSSPKKGEIIEFNSSIFAAMLSEWDADSKVYGIVRDKKELLTEALGTALKENDAVMILAGSSAGRDDYTSEIIESFGTVLIHGIGIKPGKPAVLGIAENKPVIGLPGYPVSAVVVMDQFVKSAVDIYYRRGPSEPETVTAKAGRRIVSSLKYKEFVRVRLGSVGDGLTAVPLAGGAGVISSLTKADGILEIPQNSEGVEQGAEAKVRLLKSCSEIENSLVITGSHDPVIDEIADIARSRSCGFRISSSHVGSMGAFAAVRSGQTHMGAIHLLDEETGGYNTSYVKKYFPDGGARLVKGIKRIQGIMVAKGNPLGIRSVSDLTRCRFVNRQRGAGTRVLLDHLMKKEGISPGMIDGYGNEKFTHTAVAASVASGNADAGLGIFSAAKIYDLDFIPVCNEEYDFLIGAAFAGHPYVKEFLRLLDSEEFRSRVNRMGGYELYDDRPEVI